MQGLVYKAFECFIRDTYGSAVWRDVVRQSRCRVQSYESLLNYPDSFARPLVQTASARIDKPEDALLEDLGTYLVTHPTHEMLRRLLRFCGDGFGDFVLSLDELPDRARLALPELDLPGITVEARRGEGYSVRCGGQWYGFGHVLAGMIRAMADDYGALALIEACEGPDPGGATLDVQVHDTAFQSGRAFSLVKEAV